MTAKQKSAKEQTTKQRASSNIKNHFVKLRTANQEFLSRRPHRSLRLTRRRDYARTLTMPGYWSFTSQVNKTVWKNRKTFLLLVLTYAIFTALLVGIASQDVYTVLADTLRSTGNDIFTGNLGGLGEAGLLFLTAASGGISPALNTVQQVYAGLLAILAWLTTVWLLRNLLAGHKVKLRNGLYNASAPLISTVIIALVMTIQLLPLAVAFIGYSAALSTGLLNSGVAAMLFWIVAALLTVLSLYWITSTFIALVVVTLPGMHPFKALKISGDLVIGRRFRILKRIIWMLLTIAVAWMLVTIPFILFDVWLKGLWPAIEWLPIIPCVLLSLSSLTIVWAASYIYLLYRKVVADDAKPA